MGLFSNTEVQKPNYTIRMLLSDIQSEKGGDKPKLKPFSHFTLACTYQNEESINEKFALLFNYLQGPLTLSAEEVVNLASEEKPLWAVKLNLGENAEAFRMELSQLFDNIMCHELNGTRYLWNPTGDQQMKCPHITIGPNVEDYNKAKKLVDDEYLFTFDRMDYKQLGPHDPHVTMDLSTQHESSYTMNNK